MKIKCVNAISKQLKMLFLVYLFSALSISVSAEASVAQSDQRNEIVITVRPVTAIVTDVTPDEYKFDCNYLLSNSFFNQEDKEVVLEIPESTIGWNFGEYSIRNATTYDNLGNSFGCLIKNNRVFNPSAEVVLPPSFEYKIYLSFETDQGVSFDSTNMEYLLHLNFEFTTPNDLKVRFPDNFTVLRCTPNFHRDEGNQFIVFEWQQNTAFNIFVGFIPFRIQAKVRSFRFTADIPMVFPAKGSIKGTYEEVFTTPATFSIWKINPIFAVPILFPGHAQPLTIEKVWDGIGDCKEISEPVEKLSNESLGYYYVDNANREVIVYPRFHYKGGFYEYSLGSTFVFPPEYKPYEMEAIKEQMLPFRYESYFVIDEILSPPNWELEITGDVEVKFILPLDTQPLVSESGDPMIGLEGGRPIARFVYNSPETISPSQWRIIYDLVPLRNFFWLGTISLMLLLLILVAIVFVRWRGTRMPSWLSGRIIAIVFSLVFGINFVYFLGLGGSKPVFVALLGSQLFLLTVVIITLVVSRHFQTTSEKET